MDLWPALMWGRSLRAKVAELVDALVLGASGETRESSSLSFRIILIVPALQELEFHRSSEFFRRPSGLMIGARSTIIT